MRRLRIFYAGPLSPNAADLPSSKLWYANLREPLARLGHEVIDFQWDSQNAYIHLNPEVPKHRAFIQEQRLQISAELLKQVRLRDFEAAMCGAFYLVKECDEIADFFAPNREIVFSAMPRLVAINGYE